jgi:hypothetical protein
MCLTGGLWPRSFGAFSVDHPEFVAIDRRGREITLYASDNTQHFIDSGLIAEFVLSPLAEFAGAQSPKPGTDGQIEVALVTKIEIGPPSPAGTIAQNPDGGE